jgi:serine/threonine protein kinase/formylglycine-generating enzyme required for sulfatase activity
MIQIPGYRIEREIGQGGMATIYLAVQESLQRKVVLKVMAPALAADAAFGDRFTREARTVAQLNHPNILAVYDVGSSGFNHYIAMEYADRGDLKRRIQRGLKAKIALGILKQVARALSHAHGKGFVHRDIKPENVLFRSDGAAVLSDFGIAKAIRSHTRITKTGTSIGTPHYMSPEQIQGKTVDARSDLYSLGIVFHEMLTGKVPYDASETFAIAYKHVNDGVPDLPASLRAYQPIVDRLLAKEPAHRLQSAQALLAEITRAESGKKLKRPARTTVALTTRRANPAAPAPAGSGLKWAAGGAMLSLLLGAVLFAISENPAFTDIKRSINAAVSRLKHIKSLKPTVSANEISSTSNDHRTGRQSREPVNEVSFADLYPAAAAMETGSQTPAEDYNAQPGLSSSAHGVLKVRSRPGRAEILLDGNPMGRTPLNIKAISTGGYKLTARHPYCEDYSTAVTIEKDLVSKVDVELTRGKGRITLITSPKNISFRLDGRRIKEKTPVTLPEVIAGMHTISAAVDGYYAKEIKVEVMPNQIARADLSLEKWQPGKLLVKTMPEAARVRILNNERPFSQGMLLDPGRYKIEVSAPNYLKKQQWVTLSGEPEKQYSLELTALGVIHASGVPEGASVYLDGRPAGTTPCRIPGLADGTYTLRFEKANFMPLRKKVPVRIGRIQEVNVRMMSVLDYRLFEKHLQGGQTALAKGDKANAVQAFKAALVLKPEDRAALKGLKTTDQLPSHGDTFTNRLGMEFIYIAPGSFSMGSPSTEPGRDPDERRHKVTLTTGYWLQATEVTQGQWRALMGDNPSRFNGAGKDFPVENVSYGDVQRFIGRLNDASAPERYRLPTEAEWEYGARGGSSKAFANGDISDLGCGKDGKLSKAAWYCGTARERTHAVGQKEPNAWGLYDMHGNVWEWCRDWYGAYPFGDVMDAKGPSDGKYRISRGGSWYDGAGLCRSAYRGRFSPGRRNGDLGFRLVKSL